MYLLNDYELAIALRKQEVEDLLKEQSQTIQPSSLPSLKGLVRFFTGLIKKLKQGQPTFDAKTPGIQSQGNG